MIGHENKWYVLRVKTNHELKVLKYCSNLGIQTYLPMYKRLRVWSDRKKWGDSPLFPGYLFVYVSCREFFLPGRSPSVFDYIRYEGIPASLSGTQIEQIKEMEGKRARDIKESQRFTPDDLVEIVLGPLKGTKGRISGFNNKSILTMEVKDGYRSMKIMIDREKVAAYN